MRLRPAKVAATIQKIIARGLVEDFRAPDASVQVTDVDVAADLKAAVVWVGVVAADEEVVFAKILPLRDRLQAAVASELRSKFTPRIELRLDHGGDNVRRVHELLGGK